jgi:hypothetical protein
MKLIAQIALGIIAAVVLIVVVPLVAVGIRDAADCIKLHGTKACSARLDTGRTLPTAYVDPENPHLLCSRMGEVTRCRVRD